MMNLFSLDQTVKDMVYMRLSVIPFKTIMNALNLNSFMFVAQIFSTALINALNSISDESSQNSQHIVHCYEVQRYYLFQD